MARYVRVDDGLPLWMILLAAFAFIAIVGRIALIITLVVLPFYAFYRIRAKALAGATNGEILGSILGPLLWMAVIWIIKR